MAGRGVQGVGSFGELLADLMKRAEDVKHTNTVDPALNKVDLADLLDRLESTVDPSTNNSTSRRWSFAVIETAFRDRFNKLLASTNIDSPSFVQVWNLLDIISILSDDEKCDAALLFWLVEELLDSQTIAGCRKIFDYLESRRERITAEHFNQKNLVILRSCNELLRRLSRAEDTAFCGRVFIFMFQSFPLGDRSSVNLRGEYHTENVTSYNILPPPELEPEQSTDKMVLDTESKSAVVTPKMLANGRGDESGSRVSLSKSEAPFDADKLYPIFWSLQEWFNQPKKLFDPSNFASFKAGFEATMLKFESVESEIGARPAKPMDEAKKGTKRKRSQGDDDLANAFNPKYLTSRDLFELEISDLSFRRNILVQVLILIEFLLSLSIKAKEKLSKSLPDNQNKSVMYADQLLGDEDAAWALEQKKRVAEYLKKGQEGPFFLRMVETVLSRDKNWVRWKIENCHPISKPSVSAEDYAAAKASAKKATSNKRLRPNPLGSLDLNFLVDANDKSGLERLKDPSRYRLPSVKSFQSKIELDDMDIDMARTDEEKNVALDAKASKSWRALRLASTTKFAAFDKIDKSDKINIIFADNIKIEDAADESLDTAEDSLLPKDRRSIVLSGPSLVGKSTLIAMLLDKYPSVFSKKISYTTRPRTEGETDGVDYFFVDQEKYNVLRDGDEFIEINEFSDHHYGTRRKFIDEILAKGKVPLIEADYNGVQQFKSNGFHARYIFIAPSDVSALEQRLQQSGTEDNDKIRGKLELAEKEVEQAKLPDFYDKVIINVDLDTTYENLDKFIFSDTPPRNAGSSSGEMADSAVAAPAEDTETKPSPACDLP